MFSFSKNYQLNLIIILMKCLYKSGIIVMLKNGSDLMDIETHVREIIEHIRPYLLADGGDIELIKVEDFVVYVKMSGACQGCAMIDTTLNDGVKHWIIDEIPEIKDVVLEQALPDFGEYVDSYSETEEEKEK